MATVRQTLIDIAVTKMIDHNGRIYNGEEGMEDERPLGSLYAVGEVVDAYRDAGKLPEMVEYFESAGEQATKRLHTDIKTQYEEVAKVVGLPAFNHIEFDGRRQQEFADRVHNHMAEVRTTEIAHIAGGIVYDAVRNVLEYKKSAAWLADMYQRGDTPGSLLASVTTLYGKVDHAIELLEGRYGGSILTALLQGERFEHVRKELRTITWIIRSIRNTRFTYDERITEFPMWFAPPNSEDQREVRVDLTDYASYLRNHIRELIMAVIEQDIQA